MATSGSCDQGAGNRRRKGATTSRHGVEVGRSRWKGAWRGFAKTGNRRYHRQELCAHAAGRASATPGSSPVLLPELPLGCLCTRMDASGVGLRHETAPRPGASEPGKSCPVTASGIEPPHLADRSTRTATPTGGWRNASTLAYDIEDIRMRVRSVAGERRAGQYRRPPGWRKQAKAVLGARFAVRCAGLATTERRSRRADRVLRAGRSGASRRSDRPDKNGCVSLKDGALNARTLGPSAPFSGI